MAEHAIHLCPTGALHDLRLLIESAPESVRNAFFDDDLEELFSGADVALHKAQWCEGWARRKDLTDYEREIYAFAAIILRNAAPMLPAYAPPKVPVIRQDAGVLYSESIARADRWHARKRRRRQ